MVTLNLNKSRSRNKTRSQRGGNVGAYPPAAWGFTMGTLGNGWTQFMNSLTVQPGGVNQGNQIVPINGTQKGGKRKKRRCKGGKKGGNLLAVAEQAAVPFALVAMNNIVGSRRRGNKSRHKHTRRRR
jgi:hypothetical protein